MKKSSIAIIEGIIIVIIIIVFMYTRINNDNIIVIDDDNIVDIRGENAIMHHGPSSIYEYIIVANTELDDGGNFRLVKK